MNMMERVLSVNLLCGCMVFLVLNSGEGWVYVVDVVYDVCIWFLFCNFDF